MTVISGVPLPEQQLPTHYRAALRSMLSELVVEDARTATRRAASRPRRRYLLAGVFASAVVGAGGAFAYSALTPTRPVSDKSSARCYSEAVFSPGENFPGTTVGGLRSSNGRDDVEHAIATCSALWRAGILQSGVPTAVHDPEPREYSVPPLVACVLPDGRAAIFPGAAGACLRLGLQGADSAVPS